MTSAGASRAWLLATSAILAAWPFATNAEDPFTAPIAPSHNLYGTPGLIDMPNAEMSPDGELSTTISHFAGTTRSTLSFQILPKLSGSFRYTALKGYIPDTHPLSTYYDRSFDLRYQLLDEGKLRPAVSVGLQDLIGTGLYSSEYIVATKHLGDRLQVTAGLGWGRLGSYGAIGSMGTRSDAVLGEGGIPTYDRWFRGDVAPFGGISYKISDRLTFKAEYSSDDYAPERSVSDNPIDDNTEAALFERNSSVNFGLDYRFRNGNQLSVYSLYGNTVGAQLSVFTNPRYASNPSGSETAPLPVKKRRGGYNDLGWTSDSVQTQQAHDGLRAAMQRDGLALEGLHLDGRRATVRLRNPSYNSEPQAIGRTARHMTRNLPASVETFVIVPVVDGVPMSAISVQRADLEKLEHAPAESLLQKIAVRDAAGLPLPLDEETYPSFDWSFSPYATLSVFDPDNPVRLDTGLRLQGSYRPTPNLEFSASIAKKLAGNLDSVTRSIPSGLPRVRTDYAEYSKQGDPAIEHLTVSHFGRPGANLYSRISAGYFETMYGGLSGELLWKPVDSALALGAEANWVKQRDFDQLFGFREYETTTGHVSAYYDFGNGFHGQIDAGKYLAGDIGATVAIDREFANGWSVGAYATFTDATTEEFGEGSFDKGLRFTVPLNWALGRPSRRENTITIQSLTRDGGARVNVRDRLYSRVRDYHLPEMETEWGRVWR